MPILSSSAAVSIPFSQTQGSFGGWFVELRIAVKARDAVGAAYATCRIDSGATFTVFNDEVARQLGIRVEDGELLTVDGVGGSISVWMHNVILDLPGGSTPARVGFKRGLPVPGLLGMSGFFEHFRVTFDGRDRVCELERLT